MSGEDSFKFHYAKHGAGNTPEQYSQTSVPGDGMAGITQGPDGNIWLLDNDGATVEQISSGTSTTRAYTFDAWSSPSACLGCPQPLPLF
jgi:hypothetical protein